MPCSVGAALQEVQRFRLEPQSRRFPQLIVVTPQPAREFGVFLAGPAWPHRAVQVLLDSRDVNGKIFPVYVDVHCTRESILHAAGVGRGAPLQVYFATDSEPMSQGQVLAPFEGALFRLVHFRAAPAPLPFLEDMLRSTLHWDLQVSLPFAFGPHLWLLSDSEPMRFEIDNPQMTVRSTEVARLLGYHPDRIALRPPMPPLVDYFSCGWSMAAVLVASELFPRTFASDVGPFVLVLDQRPVLQDVIWRVLAEPQVLVQELADDYADTCPDGYSVAFFGAEVLAGPEGDAFQVASCTCIRVEFVVILHFDSDDEGPGSPVSDSEVPTEASETASAPPASASSPHTQAASAATLSHSGDAPSDGLAGPPLTHLCVQGSLAASLVSCQIPACPDFRCGRVAMWVCSFVVQAFLQGSCRLTSFLLLLQCSPGAPSGADHLRQTSDRENFAWACWRTLAELPLLYAIVGCNGLHLCVSVCHFLSCLLAFLGRGQLRQRRQQLEPVNQSATSAYRLQAARVGTLWLGFPWRYDRRPDDEWEDLLPPRRPGVPDLSEEEDDAVLTDIAVLVLTPAYSPERLTVNLPIPAQVEHFLSEVQAVRDVGSAATLPRLVPAWPQPDARWAVVLAAPEWGSQCCVVCLDLWDVDGRVFSVTLPARTSHAELLTAAALPVAVAVTIYVANAPFPVQAGDVLDVVDGITFTFLPEDRQQPVLFSLGGMLESHLPWAAGPAFPVALLGDWYCLCSQQGVSLFELRPEGAFSYRRDIALASGIAPSSLSMAPGQPRPVNVAVHGFPCRTVIGVSGIAGACTETTLVNGLCLLDCRALLRPWKLLPFASGFASEHAARCVIGFDVPEGFELASSPLLTQKAGGRHPMA